MHHEVSLSFSMSHVMGYVASFMRCLANDKDEDYFAEGKSDGCCFGAYDSTFHSSYNEYTIRPFSNPSFFEK